MGEMPQYSQDPLEMQGGPGLRKLAKGDARGARVSR